jgi:hypothetical protein
MREVPDDERTEHLRLLREQANRDAETLTPRPGHPVYGLAAPSLTPAAVTQYQLSDGEWSAIMLTYGPWGDPQAGPYVAVTTMATDTATIGQAGSGPMHRDGLEAELRYMIEDERYRFGGSSARRTELAKPLAVNRETLPAGPALVCRSETVWAARLLPLPEDPPTESVVVTIVGGGVAPESVRLERVPDLRPMIEARFETIRAMIERSRGKPRVPVTESDLELEPAEGVAALRALAEFTLTSNTERRAGFAARQRPRRDPNWGRMHNALWQRAVREHQRLRGTDGRAADDAVTVAVNQLGFLQEKAPWFTGDLGLRAAALDETARHAMLGDTVPSERAQDAWARYWSAHVTRLGREPESVDPRAAMSAREALTDNCLQAWAAWTEIV